MKKRFRCKVPMNLQYFADGGEGAPGAGEGAGGAGGTSGGEGGGANPPAIDYDKIQKMLDGTLAAKEDTALKAYFKQQGLSQQEAEQAISTFKQQKAANQPDVSAMQAQLSQAQAAVRQAQIQNAATMEAISLGLDPKTIPYVLKLADMSKAVGQDGEINNEEVKNALNKVLEDVPALKPQVQQANGFRFGSAGGGDNGQAAVDNELDRIFGVKKK